MHAQTVNPIPSPNEKVVGMRLMDLTDTHSNDPSGISCSDSENVKDYILIPLYWSNCEPAICLNFVESVILQQH